MGSRGARGKPLVNVFPLGEDERITAILPIKEFNAIFLVDSKINLYLGTK